MATNRNQRRVATARRYMFDLSRSVTNGILVDHLSYTFLVNTHDKTVGRETFSDGAFDLQVMEDAFRMLEAEIGTDVINGRTLVDIGANIGTTAIPAACTWGARRVIAIEPSPLNFSLLRCNVILNQLDEIVHCVNAAVTSASGKIELELSNDNYGDHRIRMSDSSGDFEEQSRSTVEVRAATLDSILAECTDESTDLGLVWVDTQGHEGQVLQSAPRTISSGVPFIVEYWPYALKRAGGFDLLHSVIESNFSTVIDIRHGEKLRARDVATLSAKYQGQGYTDLALIP